MKLSEVCFRESVRLPGTQRRELLVRAKDVDVLDGDYQCVYMTVGNDRVTVPGGNVLWLTADPDLVRMGEPVNAYNLDQPQVRASRKRRG